MKTSAIVRIILFSLAIVILGSLLLGILSIGRLAAKLSESDFIDGLNISAFLEDVLPENNDNVYVVPGEGKTAVFEADEIDSLTIEWVAGSIVLQRADTDKVMIAEEAVSNSKYEMNIAKIGKSVEIQFCEDDIGIIEITSFKSINKDLVITVPMEWDMRELEVDAASADLTIDALNIQSANFNMASGEIHMRNCNVDKIDLDTASGDVEFSGTLNVLECDAASANCIVKAYNTPSKINMQSASGNLELFLPEDCGFTCNMQTLSGHFSSEFSTSASDGRYTYGNGACKIDLDAMSGNISIRKVETVTP